ncbi:hypothetical protein DL98DRAFT_220357 [Cadophora sp. DSE1049]|nr:hypothetical protein DL98DRAFT_220357 [Cadophora sp. DSE1049]
MQRFQPSTIIHPHNQILDNSGYFTESVRTLRASTSIHEYASSHAIERWLKNTHQAFHQSGCVIPPPGLDHIESDRAWLRRARLMGDQLLQICIWIWTLLIGWSYEVLRLLRWVTVFFGDWAVYLGQILVLRGLTYFSRWIFMVLKLVIRAVITALKVVAYGVILILRLLGYCAMIPQKGD